MDQISCMLPRIDQSTCIPALPRHLGAEALRRFLRNGRLTVSGRRYQARSSHTEYERRRWRPWKICESTSVQSPEAEPRCNGKTCSSDDRAEAPAQYWHDELRKRAMFKGENFGDLYKFNANGCCPQSSNLSL